MWYSSTEQHHTPRRPVLFIGVHILSVYDSWDHIYFQMFTTWVFEAKKWPVLSQTGYDFWIQIAPMIIRFAFQSNGNNPQFKLLSYASRFVGCRREDEGSTNNYRYIVSFPWCFRHWYSSGNSMYTDNYRQVESCLVTVWSSTTSYFILWELPKYDIKRQVSGDL